MGTYKVLFWALFALSLLIFLVNGIFTPIIRKKLAKKSEKSQDDAINKIKVGDNIILVSGIHGKVVKIKKRTFKIEICSNVIIDVDKQGIMGYFKKK